MNNLRLGLHIVRHVLDDHQDRVNSAVVAARYGDMRRAVHRPTVASPRLHGDLGGIDRAFAHRPIKGCPSWLIGIVDQAQVVERASKSRLLRPSENSNGLSAPCRDLAAGTAATVQFDDRQRHRIDVPAEVIDIMTSSRSEQRQLAGGGGRPLPGQHLAWHRSVPPAYYEDARDQAEHQPGCRLMQNPARAGPTDQLIFGRVVGQGMSNGDCSMLLIEHDRR